LILGVALWSIYLWTVATPGLRDRNGNLKGTDFLHFYIGEHVWPDFNVADSCIVIGAILLMVEIVFAKTPAHEPHKVVSETNKP